MTSSMESKKSIYLARHAIHSAKRNRQNHPKLIRRHSVVPWVSSGTLSAAVAYLHAFRLQYCCLEILGSVLTYSCGTSTERNPFHQLLDAVYRFSN